MKAKEYAARLKAVPQDQYHNELVNVLCELIQESGQIAIQRKVSNDESACAVLEEQDRKWRAIVNRLNDPNVNLNGFELAFHKMVKKDGKESLYEYWMDYRKRVRV